MLLWINAWQPQSLLDPVMLFLSDSWTWSSAGVLLLIYGLFARNWSLLKWLGCVLIALAICDAFCTYAIKHNVQRLRPCQDILDQIRNLGGCVGLYGFPSNHSANAFVVASMGWWGLKVMWVRYGLMVLAVMVALSRVYLGAHYPSDILMGAVIGVFVSAFILVFRNKIRAL